MLRNVVAGIGALMLAGGALAWTNGFDGAAGIAIFGAILLIGIVFERVIYKPNAKAAPGPGWVKTSERFVDDETGKPVTVYIKPETGERTYVEE